MRLSLIQRLKKTKVYRLGEYRGVPKRVNWEQTELRAKRAGYGAPKGVGKRVIVVDSPDPRVFEQAIFIIREDYLMGNNGRGGDILREAQDVADRYIRLSLLPPQRKKIWRIPPSLIALAGAILAGAVLLTLHLVHVF